MATFIAHLNPPRSTFLSDSTPEEQDLVGRHFEYYKSLMQEGVLRLAGLATDAEFGIVILEADSANDAQAVLEADPVISSGLFSFRLKKFRIALNGWR